MRLRNLSIWLGVLLLSMTLAAQTKYVLTTSSPSTVADICQRHGLTVEAAGWSNGLSGIFLVSSPTPVSASQVGYGDSSISGFEVNQSVTMPELSGTTAANLAQSTAGILDGFLPSFPMNYFGTVVPSDYLIQPATQIVKLHEARIATKLTGLGFTIAVIDTGVDPQHPVLAGSLVPGFDFTHNIAGIPSEWVDLSQSTAGILDQSTAGILDRKHPIQLNAYTLVLLDQSTAGILDQSTAGILDSHLTAFGHGTMTAGLVHLVAPRAQIMPIKAFSADGTSDIFSIVQAIYFAADHGAKVISMSFEIAQMSPGLDAAIRYAQNKGAVLVASAGNDGFVTSVFPAGMRRVIGIGSTDNQDARSIFSNFGSPDVLFAAPGEGVVTTYPGNHYAAAWGTSFSAPMVAGAVSLALQRNNQAGVCGVVNALARAVAVPMMGKGRVDLYQALTQKIPNGGCDTAFSNGLYDDDDDD